MKFVEGLRAKQRELGVSGREFARMLGVSNTTWVLLQQGRRQPGRKVILAAIQRWPAMVFFLDPVEPIGNSSVDLSVPGGRR